MSPESWIAISGIVLSVITSAVGWLVTWQLGRKKPELKKKQKKGFIVAPSTDRFTKLLWVLQAGICLTFTAFMAYQYYLDGYAAFVSPNDPQLLRLVPVLASFFLGIMFARSVILLRAHRKSAQKNQH